MGTNNVITAKVGNKKAQITISRPSWSDMFSSYPNENISSSDFYGMVSKNWVKDVEKDPGNWSNTCAVRMSYALNRSGIKLKMPPSKAIIRGDDGYIYWARVADLSRFLEQKLGKADESYKPPVITELSAPIANDRANNVKDNFIKKIKGRHGIVVFHVTGWKDATGHFTLWDGKDLVYVGPGSHNDPKSTEYYFWLMRKIQNNIIVQTSEILFWELK